MLLRRFAKSTSRIQKNVLVRSFSGKEGDSKPTPEEISAKEEADKKIADYVLSLIHISEPTRPY